MNFANLGRAPGAPARRRRAAPAHAGPAPPTRYYCCRPRHARGWLRYGRRSTGWRRPRTRRF